MTSRAEQVDVVVVGAGVSGLACARALAAGGRAPRVLDRARGVGGRCATHRMEGQPVDIGVFVLHGRDPAFLAALRAVPGERMEGWPRRVEGNGRPCHPDSFAVGEERVVWNGGVSTFPRHLAAGLDVRLQAEVASLELGRGPPRVTTRAGAVLEARDVVLALAPEQALQMLADVAAPPPAVISARAVLGNAFSEASLSLAAVYRPGTAPPPWDAAYPEDSRVLLAVSHDSGKRSSPAFLAMVYQARPRWSREHMDEDGWPDLLLEEVARWLGPWAATPQHVHPHRWRYARSDPSAELAGPMVLPLPGGGRLGICGDRFAPGGGVEAAWMSGTELGRRLSAAEVA
jgi:renalase